MKLRWSMDEDDFKRLKEDMHSQEWRSNNCYRGVAAGSILWEFTTESEDRELILLVNVYEAGSAFEGYGSLKDGTPYENVDCYEANYLGLIFTGTFEDFRQSVEHAIWNIASEDKRMLAKFESEMEPKWYGFEED